MENRLLAKLLTSPMTKLTWFQIQRLKKLMPNKKDVHSSSVKPDTVCSKSASVTNLFPEQNHLLEKPNKVYKRAFSTSTSHSFWNKLTTYDQQQFQVPPQLYAHKAEVEPLLVEGVGWAGQPVVRRTHPILPESYGDLSDIFTAVEKLPAGGRAHEESLPGAQTKGVSKTPNDATLRVVHLEGTGGSQNPKIVKDSLIDTKKTKEKPDVRNLPRSSDAPSLMNENVRSGPGKHLLSKEVSDPIFQLPSTTKGNGGIGRKSEATKKDKRLKKMKSTDVNLDFVFTKHRNKIKKITKVCDSKDYLRLVKKNKTKKSKKKTGTTFGVSKNRSLQSNILARQRESAQPVRKSVVIMASRQLQTYSHPNQAKVSVNIKEKTSATIVALGKKLKKSSKVESGGKYPEDCKCPETTETKTRFPTKICGEAADALKKKKTLKDRKGKMCPIEHQIKHRRRTFVCNSAQFEKAKRKRQLPKCEKPEKLIAPRVLICPPVLEDEIRKGEKKCVKQVEEVKIRSRTQVCKPMIMYQKEEKIIQVQKAVCVEKKEKTMSKHTKVCPPSEENKKQKETRR